MKTRWEDTRMWMEARNGPGTEKEDPLFDINAVRRYQLQIQSIGKYCTNTFLSWEVPNSSELGTDWVQCINSVGRYQLSTSLQSLQRKSFSQCEILDVISENLAMLTAYENHARRRKCPTMQSRCSSVSSVKSQ